MKIVAVSLNKFGDDIANRINKAVSIDIYSKNNIEEFSINTLTEKLMEEYEAIIFISSTGIAVRSIAPFIKDKTKDPAVVVIDILGKYVISLLSGHLGGANKLTNEIAEIIGAQPIITTATDNLKVTAPDIIAKDNDLIIEDMKMAKEIAALLVNGEKVAFVDEAGIIKTPRGYTEDLNGAVGVVYVTNKQSFPCKCEKKLKLIRKNIILGIGCKKNYPVEEMYTRVKGKLAELNFEEKAVKIVASIDIKKQEYAIVELSTALKAEFKTFSAEEIKEVQHKYKGSDFVEKSIGVRAVCEPVVELSKGLVITEKFNLSGMTMCIGKEKKF
jgi:cobalt-precorrin 5A hydrolase